MHCYPEKGVKRLTHAILAEELDNGTDRLMRTLGYCIDGKQYTSDKGDITDYSSVPWFARFIVKAIKIRAAGVIHDKLFKSGMTLGEKVTWLEANRVFRKIAEYGVYHTNPIQAWALWSGLLVFSYPIWRHYRRKDNV